MQVIYEIVRMRLIKALYVHVLGFVVSGGVGDVQRQLLHRLTFVLFCNIALIPIDEIEVVQRAFPSSLRIVC